MAIVQDAYDLTDDILMKILTGEYRRIGSIIRYATGPQKGQIVKHLKPVRMESVDRAQGLGAKVIELAKNNKKALIIAGIGAAAVAVGGGIYYTIKNHEPEVVTKFRASLKNYISSIRAGNLSVALINDLMASLEDLKKYKDYEKISIQLSTEELDVLVNRIFEYTEKLAKDNSVELLEDEFIKQISDDTILNLQRSLQVQKRIFESAA